jgi:hypothetical protein
MTRTQQRSLADKLNSLTRIDDLHHLLLGLNCLTDEVRDMIRAKDDTFIDELLGTLEQQARGKPK